MAITTVNTSATYLSTTSVPASKTIKGSPFTMAIRVYCVTSGSPILDTGGDIGVYIAVVGSAVSGSAFTNWASIGNSASVGSVYLDLSHNSTSEEIFEEFGSTSNNTWVHWAATYDGSGATSGVKLYKNGALVTPVSSGGSLTTADAWDRIIIGGQDGDCQDAFLFNRVLTAAEIAQLNASRFPKIDRTSIVGHWPLNPGTTFGQDFSGNGRTLTATGTVAAASRNPGVIWLADTPSIILPPSAGGTAITGEGDLQSAGSGSLAQLVGAASGIASAGTAGTQSLVSAAGGIASAGSAGARNLISASGNISSAGSAGPANLVSASGAIHSAASGTAAEAIALSGASAIHSAGAGTASQLVAAAGGIASAASGSVASVTAISAAGGIQSGAGGSVLNLVAGSGDIHSGGAGAATEAVALAAAGGITSAATGGVNQSGITGSGGVTSAGSGVVIHLFSAAVGVASAGAAVPSGTWQMAANGGIASAASGNATGGTPAAGGGDGKQTGSARRWLGALSTRRRVRR